MQTLDERPAVVPNEMFPSVFLNGTGVLLRTSLSPRLSCRPAAITKVHAAAFTTELEANLVKTLRASDAWLPRLSLVAEDDGVVVGHVVCTRALVASTPALGLGPLGVLPAHRKSGVGCALMHAVLAAADALDEPVVVLLGHTDYYPRFGFEPASHYGIEPPDPAWGAHFQARPLSTYDSSVRGPFAYAQPFNEL